MKIDKLILLLMVSALITLMFYYRVQQVELPDEPITEIEVVKPRPEKITVETPTFEGKTFKSIFTINEISKTVHDRIINKSFKVNDTIQIDDLRYLEVTYWDFDNKRKYGELIVHKEVSEDVLEIFTILYDNKYLIESIVLVDEYEANDDLSMAANNTSAFNYRTSTGGKKLSNHAYGLAIDINPVQNPYVYGKIILPETGKSYIDREKYKIGMIIKDDICYQAFASKGWTWGGDWNSLKDYQHFEFKIEGVN